MIGDRVWLRAIDTTIIIGTILRAIELLYDGRSMLQAIVLLYV
ncbi:hypothetical protein [Microcoleus sp. AT3-D2]